MFEIEKNVWINLNSIESLRLERGFLQIYFSSGTMKAYNAEKIDSLLLELNAPRKSLDAIKNFADNLDAIFKKEQELLSQPSEPFNPPPFEPKKRTRTPKTPNA